MRIVGGARRGLALAAPRAGTEAIRPTSDRLRESVFNVLAHRFGDPVPGARVLDLFAGTGALGLEAFSRGAACVRLVESGREAQELIGRNIALCGAGAAAQLLRRDATRLRPAGAAEPFTLVFCDPPYRQGLAARALAACLAGGWLAREALVIVEEAAEAGFALPAGIGELERRRYGATEVVFGRCGDPGAPPPARELTQD